LDAGGCQERENCRRPLVDFRKAWARRYRIVGDEDVARALRAVERAGRRPGGSAACPGRTPTPVAEVLGTILDTIGLATGNGVM